MSESAKKQCAECGRSFHPFSFNQHFCERSTESAHPFQAGMVESEWCARCGCLPGAAAHKLMPDSPSPALKTQDQAVQGTWRGELSLADWLEERRVNAMRIAQMRHGRGRELWQEDAAYFTAARDSVRNLIALTGLMMARPALRSTEPQQAKTERQTGSHGSDSLRPAEHFKGREG